MFCFYFFVFFSLFLKNPFITLVFPFVQYKISYLSEGEREKEKGEGGRERERGEGGRRKRREEKREKEKRREEGREREREEEKGRGRGEKKRERFCTESQHIVSLINTHPPLVPAELTNDVGICMDFLLCVL